MKFHRLTAVHHIAAEAYNLRVARHADSPEKIARPHRHKCKETGGLAESPTSTIWFRMPLRAKIELR
jgi:hypothetical protein